MSDSQNTRNDKREKITISKCPYTKIVSTNFTKIFNHNFFKKLFKVSILLTKNQRFFITISANIEKFYNSRAVNRSKIFKVGLDIVCYEKCQAIIITFRNFYYFYDKHF